MRPTHDVAEIVGASRGMRRGAEGLERFQHRRRRVRRSYAAITRPEHTRPCARPPLVGGIAINSDAPVPPLGSSEIFGFDPMPARTRLALALLLARRGRAEEAIGEGAPPGRRCSGDQYRNGSWVQIDNKTFRYP